MRIAVFTAYTRWPFHYETDLEILQRHLDAGDSVVHLQCRSDLLACDDNIYHLPERCNECSSILKRGAALLDGRVQSLPFLKLTHKDRLEMERLPKRFESIAELKKCRVEDFDIGWAVLSSIISLTRTPRPDLEACRNLVPRFMVAAFSVYRSMQNYLRENSTDRVYVFNGRFAHARAVLRACQSSNVMCITHERGHDLKHYELFENTMPHDLVYAEKQIRRRWSDAQGDPKREEIAEAFYRDRAKGVIQSWYSFTTSQRQGLLPDGWDPLKQNIAIFNSSEDEFASVSDDHSNKIYESQQDALERIVRSVASSSRDIRLYLRVHPNLSGLDNYQTRALATLKADCLTVIPADAPVSTYALLQQATRVLTFGSTVGIEAVFWGAPSILAGPTFYGSLGGTYNPASHDELIDLLVRADLPPKDKVAALMYGYYLNTYGIPFKYYEALSMTEGVFKGQSLTRIQGGTVGRVARQRMVRFTRNAIFTLRSRLRVTGRVRLK